MPERIETARIDGVSAENLEMDDTYPGTYAFQVRLTRDPGPEWGLEFESVYDTGIYPGKPPVHFRGDKLVVYYLPRYGDELPTYLRFLARVVADTNRAVELRNSVLPDEQREKQVFREKLAAAVSQVFGQTQ